MATGETIPVVILRRNVEVTAANAAFFDAANGFAGCIPGIHKVLRRQGLLGGIWCLDEKEALSRGQAEEIERVHRAYPDMMTMGSCFDTVTNGSPAEGAMLADAPSPPPPHPWLTQRV